MIEAVPLSAQQEAFLQWMQARGELRHPASVCVTLRIRDAFDVGLFERALSLLTLRHEALRMVFPIREGHRQAVILAVSLPEVEHLHAVGTSLGQKLACARDLACLQRDRQFDLARGPLVRAAVIELAPQDQVLLLAVHHLVSDGWSMEVMVRELAIIYSQLAAGDAHGHSLPEPMQCSQVVSLSRRLWPRNRHAWSRALAGAPGGLHNFRGRMPTDEFSPRLLSFSIPADLASNMRSAARANHATAFMVALTAWSAALSNWSSINDIVVMSPVAGRAFPGSEMAIGCLFFNVLIRVDVSGNPEFDELLRRVRSSTVAAWSRQDYPYGEFRDRFARSPSVSYYGSRVPPHFPGLESESFVLPPQLAVLEEDLDVPILSLRDDQEHAISAELVFNQKAFNEATIIELASDFLMRLPGSRTHGHQVAAS